MTSKFQDIDPKDGKFYEVIFKHYLDLFTYHAAQRLSTFRYYYFAFSVSATAYATLMVGGTGASADMRLAWGAFVLAVATYIIVLAFARLDRRNEQIIDLNERPLKKIQLMISEHFAGEREWQTLDLSDAEARQLTTFGKVLPLIFMITAVVSMLGALVALSVATTLSKCLWVVLASGGAAIAAVGVWAPFGLARR